MTDSDRSPQTLDELLASKAAVDPKDDQIAALEKQIQGLENKLHEDRFMWVLICITFLDAYIFTQMTNWAGPLVIGVLQLVGVVIYADRCRVDAVAPLIDKLTGAFRKTAFQGKDSDA